MYCLIFAQKQRQNTQMLWQRLELEARHHLATSEPMPPELFAALFSRIGNVEYGSKQLKLNQGEAIVLSLMSESQMSKHKKNMCWNFQEMDVPVYLSNFSTVAY